MAPPGAARYGYLGTFSYDPVNASSQFVLLDARHIDDEPIAVIALPKRVAARPARHLDSQAMIHTNIAQ